MKPETIRDIRIDSRLNQDEFADLLGISVKTLYNYENGISSPKPEILTKLFELKEKVIREKYGQTREDLPVLIKEDCTVSIDEITLFIAKNLDAFIDHPVIKMIIENRVADKILQMTENKEDLKTFLGD